MNLPTYLLGHFVPYNDVRDDYDIAVGLPTVTLINMSETWNIRERITKLQWPCSHQTTKCAHMHIMYTHVS